jgi:hypothetical protein
MGKRAGSPRPFSHNVLIYRVLSSRTEHSGPSKLSRSRRPSGTLLDRIRSRQSGHAASLASRQPAASWRRRCTPRICHGALPAAKILEKSDLHGHPPRRLPASGHTGNTQKITFPHNKLAALMRSSGTRGFGAGRFLESKGDIEVKPACWRNPPTGGVGSLVWASALAGPRGCGRRVVGRPARRSLRNGRTAQSLWANTQTARVRLSPSLK